MFSLTGVGPLSQVHGSLNTKGIFEQQHVVPSLQASPNQLTIFMQDNAPSHCKMGKAVQ